MKITIRYGTPDGDMVSKISEELSALENPVTAAAIHAVEMVFRDEYKVFHFAGEITKDTANATLLLENENDAELVGYLIKTIINLYPLFPTKWDLLP